MEMENKKIYLFDIDGTLFDSSALIKNVFHTFAQRFSLDEQVLLKLKQVHRSQLEKGSDFDPNEFLHFLSDKIDVPVKQLVQLWNEKVAYEESVFPDTLPLLHELQKRNITLGIFSEGNKAHQKQKLTHSGLWPFFDPAYIHIFRRKLLEENINTLSKNSVIIDNQKEVVLALVQANIEAIWINRDSDEELSDIKTIHTLEELI